MLGSPSGARVSAVWSDAQNASHAVGCEVVSATADDVDPGRRGVAVPFPKSTVVCTSCSDVVEAPGGIGRDRPDRGPRFRVPTYWPSMTRPVDPVSTSRA